MQNINYSNVVELKDWLSNFKTRFAGTSDAENLDKIESVLNTLIEKRKNSAAAKEAAKTGSSTINYESYVNEYKRLFDVIINTGVSLDDPIEYFEFRSAVFEAKDKLDAPLSNPKSDVAAIAKELDEKGQIYKDSIYTSDTFSEASIERVKAVNALQNLTMDINIGIPDLDTSTAGINHVLCVKYVQAVLAGGMKSSPDVYKKDFFDSEKLFRAEKDIEEAKPFVQKYQKAVNMKDRKTLITMTDDAVVQLLCKTLQKKPVQLLEYSPEYDDITKR